MKVLKKLEPIKVSNKLLQKLFTKITFFIDTKKEKALTLNKNLGSYQEADDYAQEILICLLKKLTEGSIEFYSEHQLWTYCFKVLNMLLLRQHRDYTKVKSKTATTIDIDSVYETTGKSIDDIVSYKNFNKSTSLEYKINYDSYKNFIISFTNQEVKILPVTQLFKVDKKAKIINLYAFLESINNIGLKKTFDFYYISRKIKLLLFDKLKEFFGFSETQNNIKSFHYSINTDISSRDKFLLKNLKITNPIIPYKTFRELIRRKQNV